MSDDKENIVEKNRAKNELKKGDGKEQKTKKELEKIGFMLRPFEVFILTLPVLFLPILYIQGELFQESLVGGLDLTQSRYALNFHSTIIKSIHSFDFFIVMDIIAIAILGVVFIKKRFLCECDKCEQFLSELKEKIRNFTGFKTPEVSDNCIEETKYLEKPSLFAAGIFCLMVAYYMAGIVAIYKGKTIAKEALLSLEKDYSTFTEKKYYTKEGKLLAQGVELLCSKEWCAIYHSDGTVNEIAMDNIAGVQRVEKMKNKLP